MARQLRSRLGGSCRYLRDEKGAVLGDCGGIWVLELGKFEAQAVASERDRWLKFFKEGEYLDSGCLPGWMHTAEMEQAMTVMNRFSEKEAEYHLYQARQNYLREQTTIALELEQAFKEKAAALRGEEAARLAREAALEREKEERLAKEAALEREKEERLAKEAALERENAERRAKEAALEREKGERRAKEAALAELEALKLRLKEGPSA